MCDYYLHIHSCAHTSSALGRLCNAAALVQTPCKDRRIWTTVRVTESCGECDGEVEAEGHVQGVRREVARGRAVKGVMGRVRGRRGGRR
jgi:hypothetical protein